MLFLNFKVCVLDWKDTVFALRIFGRCCVANFVRGTLGTMETPEKSMDGLNVGSMVIDGSVRRHLL